MTRSAFIIGNGPSRESIDLTQLRKYGKIFGCNALYRDFTPDYLIVVDENMAEEVFLSGVYQKAEVWTRDTRVYGRPFKGHKNLRHCSGAGAVQIAAEKGFNRIYLIGMDFWVSPVNHNIYSGTNCYKNKDAEEKTFEKQVKKWKEILSLYPNLEYIRIVPKKHVVPECFKHIEHIDLELFKEYFNGS